MSGDGAPKLSVTGVGLKVAVVASSWHVLVMDGLIAGAQRALSNAGAEYQIFRVPGAFELPLACKAATESGFDAVVALGVVIRGGTPHFEYVCTATTNGLAEVSLNSGIPVGFGLLTCDTEKQALNRAGLENSDEDKGAESVEAALAMVAVLREIAG